ncbi:MAG: PD-(D/E)XK nuclease family protein [Candidatus Nanopelagicales bacterium]|nr:PD-(D/E)XK nuclease family protein [Candidatus Nanopelagicales bacterium]
MTSTTGDTHGPIPVRERQKSDLQGHPILGALSPSRASDFLTCPLLYRYRAIDRLPERPSLAAFRGTLVHEVLDRLLDHPSADRSPEIASDLVAPTLQDLLEAQPEAAFAIVEDAPWPAQSPPTVPAGATDRLVDEARALLVSYFAMEDPREIHTAHREQLVESFIGDGVLLRGYVDRIDEVDGRLRVVDYKTGKSPGPAWEQSAMFQLRFYALVVHRSTGRVPERLQLLYLGNREVLTYHPDEEDLRRFERKLQALWQAITRAAERGDWRPRPSKKCQWCAHQGICPEFGGTMPALPPSPVGDDSLTVEA